MQESNYLADQEIQPRHLHWHELSEPAEEVLEPVEQRGDRLQRDREFEPGKRGATHTKHAFTGQELQVSADKLLLGMRGVNLLYTEEIHTYI